MRDGFIFYESFRDAMRGLPVETQLLLYNAIADYALYDEVPEFGNDGIAKGFFALMRPQIDANIRKRENGSRGGRPVKETELDRTENQTESEPDATNKQNITEAKPTDNLDATNAEPNAKEKAKVNAKDNAKEKERCADEPRRFTKPTVEDIRTYCWERGNTVDPQRFFDFYEAKGWRVGNQPMKDWQAAVRTWEGRDSVRSRDQTVGYAKKNAKPRIDQHDFNDDDLSHLLVDLDAEPEKRSQTG